MKQVFSYPPLSPLKRPLDFATPMGRLDFWLFYLAYVLLVSLSLVAVEIIGSLLQPDSPALVILSLTIFGLLLLWLAYLCVVFLSAVARRMRDSGYRRLGLAISVCLSLGTMGSVLSDIIVAYREFEPTNAPPSDVIFSPHSAYLAIAMVVSFIYIFLGTVRPTKSTGQSGVETPSDGAPSVQAKDSEATDPT